MNLKEIFAACEDLELNERRRVEDDLVDVVFYNRDQDAWNQRLEKVLGPALKPAGAKADRLAKRITQACGGIRPEQTLYYKLMGDQAAVAMFWPWANGQVTTLKIFTIPKEEMVEPETKPSFFRAWFKK